MGIESKAVSGNPVHGERTLLYDSSSLCLEYRLISSITMGGTQIGKRVESNPKILGVCPSPKFQSKLPFGVLKGTWILENISPRCCY